MAVEKVFEVLTEFRFDIQSAVASSEKLSGAIGMISNAANNALFSLNSMSYFLKSAIGFNTSFLGVLGASIASSEKFKKTALGFTNIISANMQFLSGDIDTFNDKLDVSEKIIKNIAKTAREFSLDEAVLAGTTKQLATVLVPHGLAGGNFGNALNMARMFEKSAPSLGVDSSLAQGQLIRAILGGASMNDTLFRRLATETQAFKPIGEKGAANITKNFNTLDMAKRFNLLNDALKQFSANAKVNAGMASLLSSRLRSLKNQFMGLDGILQPIGRVMTKALSPIFDFAEKIVQTKGRKIASDFSMLLEHIVSDPERLFVNLRQMAALKNDVARAGRIAHTIGFASLALMLGRMALKIPVVNTALLGLLGILARFTGIAAIKTIFTGAAGGFAILANAGLILRFVFMGLGFVLRRILLPLALVTGFFQVISRARAMADIIDAKAALGSSDSLLPALMKVKEAWNKLVSPIATVMDSLARMIAPLFAISTYVGPVATGLEIVANFLDSINNVLTQAIAASQGVFVGMLQVVTNLPEIFLAGLKLVHTTVITVFTQMAQRIGEIFSAFTSGDFSGALKLANAPMDLSGIQSADYLAQRSKIQDAFNYGVDSFFADNLKTLMDPNATDKNVANHNTHIGKVEIRQDFKENMQPDRIAHSLVKTLAEVAKNPTQAAGRSMQGAMTR